MSCHGSEVDAAQETRIVVQALKIERLEEKQEELRDRLKAVEKWVIGAGAIDRLFSSAISTFVLDVSILLPIYTV